MVTERTSRGSEKVTWPFMSVVPVRTLPSLTVTATVAPLNPPPIHFIENGDVEGALQDLAAGAALVAGGIVVGEAALQGVAAQAFGDGDIDRAWRAWRHGAGRLRGGDDLQVGSGRAAEARAHARREASSIEGDLLAAGLGAARRRKLEKRERRGEGEGAGENRGALRAIGVGRDQLDVGKSGRSHRRRRGERGSACRDLHVGGVERADADLERRAGALIEARAGQRDRDRGRAGSGGARRRNRCNYKYRIVVEGAGIARGDGAGLAGRRRGDRDIDRAWRGARGEIERELLIAGEVEARERNWRAADGDGEIGGGESRALEVQTGAQADTAGERSVRRPERFERERAGR